MGDNAFSSGPEVEGKEITLTVDGEGRVTIPEEVRQQLGIDPNEEVPGQVIGSVLMIDPAPSSKLEPATADRDSWEASTPTDSGESLFGSTETPD